MELFTLGADRGAYTEDDVRELARALTGWRSDWSSRARRRTTSASTRRATTPATKTRLRADGQLRLGGRGAAVRAQPAARLVLREKLWSYFIPTPPSAADRAALERALRGERLPGAPGARGDPAAPAALHGPAHGQAAGGVPRRHAARAAPRRSTRTAGGWLCEDAGQRLFCPPDVSGWDDARWLDTSTMRGRWEIVTDGRPSRYITGRRAMQRLRRRRDAAAGRRHGARLLGQPGADAESRGRAHRLRRRLPATPACRPGSSSTYRGLRQNALRQLISCSPDLQVSMTPRRLRLHRLLPRRSCCAARPPQAGPGAARDRARHAACRPAPG